MLGPYEILLGMATSLFIYSLISMQRDAQRDANVVEAVEPGLKTLLEKLPSPFVSLQGRSANLKEEHPWKRFVLHLDILIIRSGEPGNLNSKNIIDLCFYASIIGTVLMLVLANLALLPVIPLTILGFVAFLLAPYLSLRARAVVRQRAIRKELPVLLDLFTLCVESGMDFTTSLLRIGTNIRSPDLGSELQFLMTELRMGKTREASLKDFSNRIGLAEVSMVVNSILQADRLGASMGPALRIQATEMRQHRVLAAEEAAMKAPVKLIFPLVLFIFPTTFIILFAPMIIPMLP